MGRAPSSIRRSRLSSTRSSRATKPWISRRRWIPMRLIRMPISPLWRRRPIMIRRRTISTRRASRPRSGPSVRSIRMHGSSSNRPSPWDIPNICELVSTISGSCSPRNSCVKATPCTTTSTPHESSWGRPMTIPRRSRPRIPSWSSWRTAPILLSVDAGTRMAAREYPGWLWEPRKPKPSNSSPTPIWHSGRLFQRTRHLRRKPRSVHP